MIHPKVRRCESLTSTRCEISEPTLYSETGNNVEPYVIVMVGLPGRGKSYISARLNRWLNWKGLKSKIFNLGDYRRTVYSGEEMNSEWFNPSNSEKRERLVDVAICDLKNWLLSQEGVVGIIDGTNSTVSRREHIKSLLSGLVEEDRILWIENIVDSGEVVLENIRCTKLNNLDYSNKPESEAVKDFINRITEYEKVYQKLELDRDRAKHFVQMVNGKHMLLNLICNQLDQRLVYFLMNLHQKNIPLYLCRHGESTAQVKKIIGTDPELTEKGERFAGKLVEFIDNETSGHPQVNVFCSLLKRSLRTAKPFTDKARYNVKKWSELNEIYGGHFEGSTYAEIEEQWPKIFKLRQSDKYTYSWPGGESYRQMIGRLENIFLEIERATQPLLIIAHQGVCRGIYAYMMHMLPEHCTELDIDSHVVYKFTNRLNQPVVESFKLTF